MRICECYGALAKIAKNEMSLTPLVGKKIGDVTKLENRYRDAPNDLVPEIIGLRAIASPLNFVSALLSAPCLSGAFCSITQSPHTLPYQWNNLQQEAK